MDGRRLHYTHAECHLRGADTMSTQGLADASPKGWHRPAQPWHVHPGDQQATRLPRVPQGDYRARPSADDGRAQRVFGALLESQVRRPHKYHAVSTEVDGIRFQSKREAKRYG